MFDSWETAALTDRQRPFYPLVSLRKAEKAVELRDKFLVDSKKRIKLREAKEEELKGKLAGAAEKKTFAKLIE